MSSLRTAALPLLALSMILSRCALARTVTIVITGTVASGTDVSGVFGKPGAQLSGRFTLIFTFDDSNGEQQRPDCRGGPPYSPRICSSSTGQSTRGTAALQIGDSIPFDFGVPVEHTHPAATRTTWTWPQSSYRMTLGVGDGSSMVSGAISSANISAPQTQTTKPPPALNAEWDSPFFDGAASSVPGINFTIDDSQSGAKAFGLLAATTICVGDQTNGCSTSLCRPRESYMLPNFVPHPQEMPLWCWAASGQMVMNWLRPIPAITQCSQVNAYASGHPEIMNLRNVNCCDPKGQSVCNIEGWPELKANGFDATQQVGPLPFDKIKNEISCGKRPILFTWIDIFSGHAHMMVVVGYRTDANGMQELEIYDPQHNWILSPWPSYAHFADPLPFKSFGDTIYGIVDTRPTQVTSR